MTVKKDWSIDFSDDRIEKLEGESFKRILASPRGREDWAAALADARELAMPAALWDFFPVREFGHGQVLLEGGQRFGGGPFAEVVAGASELVVAVCTIGEALGLRVQEHQRGRRMLRGMLLDNLGSWAVDSVRLQFCESMRREAGAAGLQVSSCLSPGESEWPLEEQRVIFALLDPRPIGVSLSPSLLMSPIKSLSLVMGRGDGPLGHEGGSNCDFCTMKDRCVHRARRAIA
jgi:hypothetical protein